MSKYTPPQGINESANFRFLQRQSITFGFRRDSPQSLASCLDYRPRKMASCRHCLCDSASCRDSQQEAKSHGQSLQEAINQAQKSRQEARDRGQSWRKPNMSTVSAGSVNQRTRLYPVSPPDPTPSMYFIKTANQQILSKILDLRQLVLLD